jgi:hypothetical protein
LEKGNNLVCFQIKTGKLTELGERPVFIRNDTRIGLFGRFSNAILNKKYSQLYNCQLSGYFCIKT